MENEEKRRIKIMRRTKMAALGMVMVLSMAACVGRAETTAEGATMKSMEMDSGESEENICLLYTSPSPRDVP